MVKDNTLTFTRHPIIRVIRLQSTHTIHIPETTRILCCAWTPMQRISGKWSFRWSNCSSDFGEKAAQKRAPCGSVENYVIHTQRCMETCNALVISASFVPAKLECNLGYCPRKNPPSKLSLLCSGRTSALSVPLSWLTPFLRLLMWN